jgi:hypothetical protein
VVANQKHLRQRPFVMVRERISGEEKFDQSDQVSDKIMQI